MQTVPSEGRVHGTKGTPLVFQLCTKNKIKVGYRVIVEKGRHCPLGSKALSQVGFLLALFL